MPRPSREAAIAMALVAACAGFAVASPHFATAGNLLAVARRCIDLGAGGTRRDAGAGRRRHRRARRRGDGVASIAVGKALRAWAPGVLAALAGPAVGSTLGGAAALAVVGGQMPPIVATLGLWGVAGVLRWPPSAANWLSGLPRPMGC